MNEAYFAFGYHLEDNIEYSAERKKLLLIKVVHETNQKKIWQVW